MDFIYKPIAIRLAVPADAPDMAEIHMRSWEVAYKDQNEEGLVIWNSHSIQRQKVFLTMRCRF